MNSIAKVISINAHAGYERRVRLFWILVSVSMLSFLVYIYAINATSRNIARGDDLERQLAEMSADINTLEFSYIELKNDITLELARDYGFKEARTPLYVSRTRDTLSLNTSGE
jgi:hypothetical protein